MADEKTQDEKLAAKDAAIANLKAAEPNVHADTAYNMLRADPAFQPENPEDRVYIMEHWAAVKAPEKFAEAAPAT